MSLQNPLIRRKRLAPLANFSDNEKRKDENELNRKYNKTNRK